MKLKLTKDQVLDIVKYTLVFVGGILITKGLIEKSLWQEISGGVSTLVGSIWAVIAGKKK